MTIEFECGTVQSNVGVPAMALSSHIKVCTDKNCVEDCKKELAKVKGFSSDIN